MPTVDMFSEEAIGRRDHLGVPQGALRLRSTIVETNLSLGDYRQNLIVKKVGSCAAIVAVPALITGYHGMNVPYPGSGQPGGVLASTALIIAASLFLFLLFRWRDRL